MKKRRTTTKDVALLAQLHEDGQLDLAPEFQRNSVWPRAAKAYLIDTILHDLPIPPLLFRRSTNSGSGRPGYEVVDGQQRLRAVFSFLDNSLSLGGGERQRFRNLSRDQQEVINNYDFVVEELTGYNDREIIDIFTRTNRYTVRLNQQELRNAQETGKFAVSANSVGSWPFWASNKVFTVKQIERMINVEFAAELLILLAEGPQDKKSSIDTWYLQFREEFPLSADLTSRLDVCLTWVQEAIPNLSASKFRRPVHFYALIGALDQVLNQDDDSAGPEPVAAGQRLANFESKLDEVARANTPLAEGPRTKLDPEAHRYALAASRQTNNIRPRETRIAILVKCIVGA